MNRAAKFIRGVGVAGLALAALGWWLNRQGFYAGWLAAFTLLLGWSLGSVALLLIHRLTGGRWGDALRPALRIGASTVALLLPACVPLVLGLAWLYPWARPGAPGNASTLNLPFFAVRGAIYLVVWFVLAVAVLRVGTLARIAPLGLLLLAFTTTFAAIDTTMSLDRAFRLYDLRHARGRRHGAAGVVDGGAADRGRGGTGRARRLRQTAARAGGAVDLPRFHAVADHLAVRSRDRSAVVS